MTITNFFYGLIAATALLQPLAVQANPQESFKQQMLEGCEDGRFRNLRDFTDRQCYLGMTNVAEKCYGKFSAFIEDQTESNKKAVGECVLEMLSKEFNVTKQQINDAKNATSYSYVSKEGVEEFNEMMSKGMLENSVNIDVSKVTLPIFPGATPLSTSEMFEMDESKLLPAIIVLSKQQKEKVFEFYKKQLPNYKFYSLDLGMLFIEKGPEGEFDFSKHFDFYRTYPHVMISDAQYMGDYKTSIEIGYRKK
ncbi:MAG: hypothetical protein D6B28_03390 [Gammaproteobacteria bacterium]|nr:MAG: hypothetical protein D6B28_03390 [Gammaproteobacteria bacterium]